MKNWLFTILVFVSCNNKQSVNNAISKDEMLQIVKKCDSQFSIGVQKKDSTILANIYTDSAQYVQPNKSIIIGKADIGKDWVDFLNLKEKPVDMGFLINDVRGNREIIYETGVGYTLLADSSKWNWNYVNIWRLQKDGSYKLDIDTYTSLDK